MRRYRPQRTRAEVRQEQPQHPKAEQWIPNTRKRSSRLTASGRENVVLTSEISSTWVRSCTFRCCGLNLSRGSKRTTFRRQVVSPKREWILAPNADSHGSHSNHVYTGTVSGFIAGVPPPPEEVPPPRLTFGSPSARFGGGGVRRRGWGHSFH